ncbi:MAG: hypothetical protein MSJ26_06510 [Oscillospiraceae bacterium]|nr:hypothetical protein [Oscillospiraceae bacterium]
MGTFFSLRRSGGLMIAAAALSYIVMVIHREYLLCLPLGSEDALGEIFFGIQSVLLVAEMIFGLMAVGCLIFLHPAMKGLIGLFLKLLLIIGVSAAALGAVRLVAYFGGVNASPAVHFIFK